MSAMRIPCYLEFDERTSVVTMRHAKTNTIQMTVKLEAGATGTMGRLSPDVDCDNWWIAFKPADSVVVDDRLFGEKKLVATQLSFDLL